MKTKGQMLSVVVLVSLALCALPARSIAAAQGSIEPLELQAFLDSVINGQLKAYHIPGATVSVVKNGQLFFARGYGDADLAQHRPVAADQTLFGPGSIAKLLTWTKAFNVVLLGVCIILFASMLLTLIVPRRDYGYSTGSRFAYRLVCCLSALSLIFLAGILIALSRPYATTHEIIPYLMPLLIAALIAASLMIGAAAATFLVWKRRYWNLTARIHYTLVALAAVAFVWWLNEWNLVGLRL